MADRQDVISVARAWLGTPYLHQASCKGAGTDCLGLVRGVWREIYGDEPEKIPAYTPDWNEASQDEVLLAAARRHLIKKSFSKCVPGDVLLFRMRHGMVAKHLGIVSDTDTHMRFIHAYSGHGVVENTLSAPWRKRVVGCLSFPIRGEN